MRFPALGLFVATVAVVVSFGGGASGAPVPKHLMKAEEPNFQHLQGEWQLNQLTFGGRVLQGADVDIVLEVRGDRLFTASEKQNRRTTTTVKLDARANPPRLTWAQMKVTNLKGETIKDDDAEKPGVMIYRITGGTLVFAVNSNDQTQPPKGFGGKDGPGVTTMTFTRVKK